MVVPMTADISFARPPSQALLDLRWQWIAFGCLLVITAIILCYVGDVSDCLLFIILFAFLYEMLRDGCQEMHKYVSMYGALLALAFISYALRLMTDVLGKIEISASRAKDGHPTVMQTTHNFFDLSQGFKYNLESISEILTSLCCGVGMWLSLCVYRMMSEQDAEEVSGSGRAQEERRRALGSLETDMRQAMSGTGEVFASPTPTERPQHFIGKAYKITDDTDDD